MPWNITAAVIDQIVVNSLGGVAVTITINYHYLDGQGVAHLGTVSRNLTGGEQNSVDTFLGNIATSLSTQTGLTVTLN
jgi:hypothetical protein